MAVRIRIDVEDRAVRRAIAGLGDAAKNMRPAFERIGQELVTSTVRRFEQGVGPDGAPWRPSARAAEQDGRTLVDKGHLRDSIQHIASSDEVVVGSNVIYAAIHQLGSGDLERPKNIPARPFLGVDDEDGDAIVDIVRRFLDAAA